MEATLASFLGMDFEPHDFCPNGFHITLSNMKKIIRRTSRSPTKHHLCLSFTLLILWQDIWKSFTNYLLPCHEQCLLQFVPPYLLIYHSRFQNCTLNPSHIGLLYWSDLLFPWVVYFLSITANFSFPDLEDVQMSIHRLKSLSLRTLHFLLKDDFCLSLLPVIF